MKLKLSSPDHSDKVITGAGVTLDSFRLYDLPLKRMCLNHKLLISTLNAHSYNVASHDSAFVQSLRSAHTLLPDGISVVLAKWLLTGRRIRKIAGMDLFNWEMHHSNKRGGKVFFLGSSPLVLSLIATKVAVDYPRIQFKSYSPPYKAHFTEDENREMIQTINDFAPDVLFVGMTAPKQEKWAHAHFDELKAKHVCSIGAVFDYYAGSVQRAPRWIIGLGMEWCYRLVKEPRRLWRRYLVGNTQFVLTILKEYLQQRQHKNI